MPALITYSLAALLSLLCGYLLGRSDARRIRARRRGGYVRLAASARTKARAYTEQTPETATTAPISFFSPLGGALADAATPPTPRHANRTTAHGSSTAATATLGASGERPAPAGSSDYCRCGAHTKATPCYITLVERALLGGSVTVW